jgi:hypothetical protein
MASRVAGGECIAVRVLVVLAAFILLYGCGQASSPVEKQEKKHGVEQLGGGEQHQQAKARPLPEGEKALPPGEYDTEEFKPSFSFHVGKGWRTPSSDLQETPDRLIIAEGKEVKGFLNLLIFRNVHEVYDSQKHKWVEVNSSKELVSWFQHHPYLKAEKPQSVMVGGVKGVQFDYVLAEDSPEDEVKSFRYSDGLVASVVSGTNNQGLILDVKGQMVSITIGSATSEFDEFLPKAQKVVDTLKWGGS